MTDRRDDRQRSQLPSSFHSRPVPAANAHEQAVAAPAETSAARPAEEQSTIQPYKVLEAHNGCLTCPLTEELGRHPWSDIPYSGKPKADLAGNFTRRADVAGGRLRQYGVRNKAGIGKVRKIKWTHSEAKEWKVIEPVSGGILRRQGHIEMDGKQVVDKLKWEQDGKQDAGKSKGAHKSKGVRKSKGGCVVL